MTKETAPYLSYLVALSLSAGIPADSVGTGIDIQLQPAPEAEGAAASLSSNLSDMADLVAYEAESPALTASWPESTFYRIRTVPLNSRPPRPTPPPNRPQGSTLPLTQIFEEITRKQA